MNEITHVDCPDVGSAWARLIQRWALMFQKAAGGRLGMKERCFWKPCPRKWQNRCGCMSIER